MSSSFATELDHLIANHVGHPKYGDDLQPIADALHAASNKWAMQADRLRWRDESVKEFRERLAGIGK
jgi:hypothetical protein